MVCFLLVIKDKMGEFCVENRPRLNTRKHKGSNTERQNTHSRKNEGIREHPTHTHTHTRTHARTYTHTLKYANMQATKIFRSAYTNTLKHGRSKQLPRARKNEGSEEFSTHTRTHAKIKAAKSCTTYMHQQILRQ